MKVHDLRVYDSGQLQPDPLAYARQTGLVNNHQAWVRGHIGAWRWHLIDKHGERIRELVSAGYTIDLGGGAAPVGYGAVVVDYLNPMDKPRALYDVPGGADCIFASHVLEHFVDLDNALVAITQKLKPGGYLIAQVPSWTKQNLWPEHHPYHAQVIGLARHTNAPERVRRLDTMLEAHGFTIELTDEFDGNILVIAHK